VAERLDPLHCNRSNFSDVELEERKEDLKIIDFEIFDKKFSEKTALDWELDKTRERGAQNNKRVKDTRASFKVL